MEIMSKPIGSILTSVPSRSPTNSLPPRRARYCSPSSSQAGSIQGEVFTDSEVSYSRKGKEAIESSNTRRCIASRVDPPAFSPQNCYTDTIKAAEPIIKIHATMDWKEAEEVVVDQFGDDLEAKLNLYTPDDIYEDYDEVSPYLQSDDDRLRYNHEVLVEFRKKLGGIREACCRTEKSIKALLQDYGDSMPSRQKAYWTKQATEIPHLVKSHENELRAAVKSVTQLILASASNSSESDESKASKDLTLKKKKQVSTELKSDGALENDAGKLQNKCYGEHWIKIEEPDNPTLLHDDHETIDDNAAVTREDCEGLEKVEGYLDKIQYPGNKENDENGDNLEELKNIALLLDDNSPVDDQCQKEEKVNWAGVITSSNTKQCLCSSPAISPTWRKEEQVQSQESKGKEKDNEN